MSRRGEVEMIAIPAGDFTMGSDDDRFTDRPSKKVYLDGYSIGKNLVTVKQFRDYCAAQDVDFSKFPAPPWGWIDDHPMVNLKWGDARAFCLWAGGDLPTEAQWEKAARGSDGRKFPWGNDWDNTKLWCSFGTVRDRTAPVGSRPSGASPYGCLDMLGNAAQFTRGLLGPYNGYPDRNPVGYTGKDSFYIGQDWFSIKGVAYGYPQTTRDRTDLEEYTTYCRQPGNRTDIRSWNGFRLASPSSP